MQYPPSTTNVKQLKPDKDMETKKKVKRDIIAVYSNKHQGDAYKMHVTPTSNCMTSPEFRDIIRGYLERLEDLTEVLHLVIDSGEHLMFTVEKWEEDNSDYLYDVKFTSKELDTVDDSHRVERISEDMSIEETLDYIQSFHDFSVTNTSTWG